MTIETSAQLPATHNGLSLMFWEEYVRWALANEFPSEWVDGQIIDVLPQNLRSNLIVQFLHQKIRRLNAPKPPGRLIFNFLMRLPNRPSGRVPDLMYVSHEHGNRVTDLYLDGPADLVIEVVSKDSLVRDRRDKFLEYEAGGVREYWLIDEYHEEARFYVPGADGRYHEPALSEDGVYASTVVPGLQLSVERLWHEPFASFREDLNGRTPDPTLPDRSTRVTVETNGHRAATRYLPPRVSWEEFHDWALTIEGRAEWIDGEIVEIVGDSIRHFFLVHFIANLLKRHVDNNSLGFVFIETIVLRLLSRPTGRMPDVFFLRNEHRDRIRGTFVVGPADIVVEVVSADSEIRDHDVKFVEYEAAGIPEYWLIDEPRHEALFFVLGEDGKYAAAPIGEDGVYASTVLEGLRLRVDWLWRDPLPTLDEALADLPA